MSQCDMAQAFSKSILFERADPANCGDQFSGKGEWQTSLGQVKGSDMIRATLSKLKAWLSPDVVSSGAKPVGKAKGHSSAASAQLAESAKKTKRRAQRQARARNR